MPPHGTRPSRFAAISVLRSLDWPRPARKGRGLAREPSGHNGVGPPATSWSTRRPSPLSGSERTKKLWSRAHGEGHSSILVQGGRLYTMYRPGGLLTMVRRSQEEVVAALDAATGSTIWE